MQSKSKNKQNPLTSEKLINTPINNKEKENIQVYHLKPNEIKIKNINALYNDIPKPSSSKNVNKEQIEFKKHKDDLGDISEIKNNKYSPLPLQVKRDLSPAILNLNKTMPKKNSKTDQNGHNKISNSNNVKKQNPDLPNNVNHVVKNGTAIGVVKHAEKTNLDMTTVKKNNNQQNNQSSLNQNRVNMNATQLNHKQTSGNQHLNQNHNAINNNPYSNQNHSSIIANTNTKNNSTIKVNVNKVIVINNLINPNPNNNNNLNALEKNGLAKEFNLNVKQSLTPTGLNSNNPKTLFSSIKKKDSTKKANEISVGPVNGYKDNERHNYTITPSKTPNPPKSIDLKKKFATLPKKPSDGVGNINNCLLPTHIPVPITAPTTKPNHSNNNLTKVILNDSHNENPNPKVYSSNPPTANLGNGNKPKQRQNNNSVQVKLNQANVNTTKARLNNHNNNNNNNCKIVCINHKNLERSITPVKRDSKEVNSISNSNSIINSNTINKCFKDYAFFEDINSDYRNTMEDFILVLDNFCPGMALFGLFDGHGGDQIAKYVKEKFPAILKKNISKSKEVEEAINNSFKQIDNDIKGLLNMEKIGTTASIVLLQDCSTENSKLNNKNGKVLSISANVGDSRVVLLSSQSVKKLSYDHKGTDSVEADRVKKSGGVIFGGRVYGKFALTRALGDFELKQNGVISNPYISKKVVDENDNYIIIASDGVWDVLSNEFIIELSHSCRTTDEFTKNIVSKSIERGSQDNISCIVIKLR